MSTEGDIESPCVAIDGNLLHVNSHCVALENASGSHLRTGLRPELRSDAGGGTNGRKLGGTGRRLKLTCLMNQPSKFS